MTPPKSTRESEVSVGFLLDTRVAIDFSPIYLLTLTSGLRKGQTLRFDPETKTVTKIEGNNYWPTKNKLRKG